MRVALLSHNAQADDAIGNQVAEKLAFFLERGADVRVFVESAERLHPAVRPYCRRLEPIANGDDWDFLSSADLVVAEYGQAYPLLGLLPLLSGGRGRILFDYHGVTPPEFWEGRQRELLRDSQKDRGLVWCADAALVHSRYTRHELLSATQFPAERTFVLGHPRSEDSAETFVEPVSLRARLGLEGATILLFVGRLAPNKRVPVLVEALGHLRDLSPPLHAVVIGDAGDVYAGEAEVCRRRAVELGIVDRLHMLGQVPAAELRQAYQSADAFIMPSRHEGFCIPVMEALAAGLPVVAARAGALPETLGSAGLTFVPDDAEDLARQVRRVLEQNREKPPRSRLRIAVVSYRYGTDFVGGAETSLRIIAEALHQAGHAVEVFTTCTRGEGATSEDHPEGANELAGIWVQRFRSDARNVDQYEQASAALQRNPADPGAARTFLRNSVNSGRLVDALRERRETLDAIIVGPYGVGLTQQIAREFPDRTLVLPCFHDEPLARLPLWAETYGQAGGLLFHTPEEQELAETVLGVNHPRAICCGTVLDTEAAGNAERGRRVVGMARPYVVYCGRYSREKRLPELLDAARAYAERYPDRFTFVFLGAGAEPIRPEPWARDLGFVDEATKRDVLAGAAALVLPSRNESLSLAALEAWIQGVPVIADRGCSVLAGHFSRGAGGRLFDGSDGLAVALDDLWDRPAAWRELGRQGRDYVCANYGSTCTFAARLAEAGRTLREPLADCMRRRGRDRARHFSRARWRERFAALVEHLLDAEPRSASEGLTIVPRATSRTVAAGSAAILVPIRVTNNGTLPVVPDGPARTALRAVVDDEVGRETTLPQILVPGQSLSLALPVPVPKRPGSYPVSFEVVNSCSRAGTRDQITGMLLTVSETREEASDHCCTPMLELAQAAMAAADETRRLPTSYVDVTAGWFAAWKRWLKHKLLGNFKRAYVDVLSRQQSAFNEQTLTALRELAECCATLDSTARTQAADEILKQLHQSQQRCQELEERVRRLEEALATMPGHRPP